MQKSAETPHPLTPILIAILGPTASGKTALAIHLAQLLKTEIVSIDSRGIYQGLPALTAVPNGQWRQPAGGKNIYVTEEGIPYHLVDFLHPSERWSAHRFREAAIERLDDIFSRREFAIVAGGSGFYWRALSQGLTPSPEPDPEIRQRLEDKLQREGLAPLAQELRDLDPATCLALDLQNPRRVVRALELCIQLGEPLSQYRRRRPAEAGLPWAFKAFYLDWPSAGLKERIGERAQRYLPVFLEEIRRLESQYGPQTPHLAAFEALLADPIWELSKGSISASEALAQCVKTDYHYAKRQRTWFRREPDLIKIPCAGPDYLQNAAGVILNQIKHLPVSC